MRETLLASDLAARGHRLWSRSELELPLEPNATPGVLVAIEGADGAGKTTLARGLARGLERASIAATVTRLPTPGMRRSRLFRLFAREHRFDRVDYVAIQVMHMADRLQHQFEVVRPALAAGQVVVADRYLLATLAVMTRNGDADLDWLRALSRRLVRPDVWLLLHAPAPVAEARIRARAAERDAVLDAATYDAGNRFGIEMARAAMPLASYLPALIEDVTDRLRVRSGRMASLTDA